MLYLLRYLEVATLSATVPFDEIAYKDAVLEVSHEQDEVDSIVTNSTANDSVNQMISSLAFA